MSQVHLWLLFFKICLDCACPSKEKGQKYIFISVWSVSHLFSTLFSPFPNGFNWRTLYFKKNPSLKHEVFPHSSSTVFFFDNSEKSDSSPKFDFDLKLPGWITIIKLQPLPVTDDYLPSKENIIL